MSGQDDIAEEGWVDDSDMSSGVSNGGTKFHSVDHLWKEMGKGDETTTERKRVDEDPWYSVSQKYWTDVPSTINGMLGGYGHISAPDVKESLRYLQPYFAEDGGIFADHEVLRALDCGAGIGRISKNVLVPLFDTVDLVEQDIGHINKAKKSLAKFNKAERFINQPLQECELEPGRYSLIWIQWCVGYLTDVDLVTFFQKCKEALTPKGVIVMKENVLDQGFWLDDSDRNLVRSDDQFKSIIAEAGLTLQREHVQTNFPKELFKVKFYTIN